MRRIPTFQGQLRRLVPVIVLTSLLAASTYAVEPIRGMVGVGTWGTQAEFKDIKITQGAETLYASDFSQGMEGWKVVSGEWEVSDGVLRQTSDEEGARALIGDPDWSNYTITLKARKLLKDEQVERALREVLDDFEKAA